MLKSSEKRKCSREMIMMQTQNARCRYINCVDNQEEQYIKCAECNGKGAVSKFDFRTQKFQREIS